MGWRERIQKLAEFVRQLFRRKPRFEALPAPVAIEGAFEYYEDKNSRGIVVEAAPVEMELKETSVMDKEMSNKIGRVTELPDTPAVRGMIEKVQHLVRIVDEK